MIIEEYWVGIIKNYCNFNKGRMEMNIHFLQEFLKEIYLKDHLENQTLKGN